MSDAPRPAELLSAPWRTAPTSVRLLDALEADGRPARFVGGCVRDSLAGLDRAAWDLDLCTAEAPERVMALLDRAGVRAIPTGFDHGTVTAVLEGQSFEITTLRRDTATDGRHAVVAFTDDFRADAARRDFTINAMSCDRAGRLYDYFGGRCDLVDGRVRFVGVPARRIEEDYLRVLRFFRFYAGFGRQPPETATAAALRAGIAGLDRLSGERVQQETLKLLRAGDPREAVRWMQELDVLGWLLEGAADRRLFDALVPLDVAADAMLRLAALLRGSTIDSNSLAARLKLSNADGDRLRALAGVSPLEPTVTDVGELRRSLYRHGVDMTIARGVIALAERQATTPAAIAWRRRVLAHDLPRLPVAGRDVVALGVPPGPDVGAHLRAAESWWLAGGCIADREAALRWLQANLSGTA